MNNPFNQTDAAERAPNFSANDPYQVLGVMQTASRTEIKRAYFALIRQYPPETEPDTFKLIRAAYEKVKNVKQRAETDMFLPHPPPAWQPPEESAPPFKATFHPDDIKLIVHYWGDLGRTDFSEDFGEIPL